MTTTHCKVCGVPLKQPEKSKRGRKPKYCSARCRQKARGLVLG